MHVVTQTRPSITRVGGRCIEYRVQYSPAAKRRRIQVGPAGVVVVLPRGQSPKEAAGLLKQNGEWVSSQLDSVARLTGLWNPQKRSLLFRGEEVELQIEESSNERAKLECGDGKLRIFLPIHRKPSEILERWMRREARPLLADAVACRARQMGVRPNQIFVRGQRTKWGNCSRLRNLSFNWRLLMAPPEVLDYLVVHELAHLREPSHSPRFWLIVQTHCPNFAKSRDWLRLNAHRLRLPD